MSDEKKDEKRAPAVNKATREINYLSFSAIAKFNPDEYGGCPRRWAMRYCHGFEEPEKSYQKTGTQVHAQIEQYTKSGQDVLGVVAAAGKHLLTAPGRDLLVEWGLNDKPKPPPLPDGREGFFPHRETLLYIADVPIIGFIDLVNPRGVYTDERGATVADPPGVIEINDNKTSSDIGRAKEGAELIKTSQMAGYALWATEKYEGLTGVRLSHTNFQTGDGSAKRAASKKTALATIAQIEQRRYELSELIEKMKRVAKVSAWKDIPPTLHACSAYKGRYSKGCPFIPDCFKSDPYAQMMINHGSSPQGENPMALTDKIRSQINGTPPAPAPAAPQPVALTPAPVPAPVAARRMGPVQVEVSACEIGRHYIIDGAAMDGVFDGTTTGGGGLGFFNTAQGRMQVPLTNVVIEVPVAPVPSPAASPAPVPQTAPTLMAVPAPVASAPMAQAAAPAPVGAPVAAPAQPWASGGAPVAGGAPAPVASAPPVAAEAPKAKRAKRAPATAPAAVGTNETDELYLYVDCVPNTGFVLLDQYIHEVTSALAKAHGIGDLRAPPNENHPAAFARWRGLLADAVRATPPPPGVYVCFAKESEFAQVVVEALTPFCNPGAFARAR